MADAVIAAVAVVALILSLASYIQAARTRSAQLLLDLRKEYDGPEMHEALQVIADWAAGQPDEAQKERDARAWASAVPKQMGGLLVDGRVDPNNQPLYIQWARRRVSSHYQRACMLHDRGHLGCRDFQVIAQSAGIELMWDSVQYLERAWFDEMRSMATSDESRTRLERGWQRFEQCLGKLKRAQDESFCLLHGR